MDKLIIHTHKSIHFIKKDQIKYLRARSNYTELVLKTGKSILSSRTLGHFEKCLLDTSFVRVHKSYLLNLCNIEEIRKNGSLKAVMEDGDVIPVSSGYKDQTLKMLLK